MSRLGRLIKYFSIVLVITVLGIFLCNAWVIKSTEGVIYSSFETIPENNVALVLGTSNKRMDGTPNPFFENRIKTAAGLFFSGKVKHFIVSGDNRTKYYNEPQEMRKALIRAGVPDSAITLDYAGLRTLDSVIRSKEIFGQERITIITQPFHSYRALFISQYYNIQAVAIVAAEPTEERHVQVYFREYLARTKAILDLYVLKTAPRHLGVKEPVKI
ncbi:MAG: DUF218 domain-containing protein [Flammeovirgaceae bacterium]|nr:DUF218 domain-containing protein [Flammeovirgaceae bacterium]